MVKYVVIFSLPPGTNPDELYSYWIETHATNIKRHLPGIRKYVIDRVIGAPEGEPQFFGMAQLWFDDVEAIEKAHSKLPVDDFRSRISNIIRVYTEEKEIEL